VAGAEAGSDERLRRFEAVTDAALARLDVEELLATLLDRIRDLMDVDTAVFLLLDPHAQQLIATASWGLEEEVRQGFRVAVGHGFAGRVARDRAPVILDEVTAADVVSPILRAKGVRSLLGVPILQRGDLVGVLHVGSLRPRAFSTDDIKLLQLVADRASLAGQIRSHDVDRTAALALQRSLLPTRLPEVAGVELAARYVPGHDAGVGGDWYDVFTLPSGWLGVVVGDVSGHGLRSAVVMGRLRSALRAYALICADPADALSHLDRKINHFEAGSLATVLYAMIAPDRASMLVSLAGHPPPMLARAGGATAQVPVPTDFPLGLGRPRQNRRNTTIAFAPGDLLVCYTDGLVERRGELIDEGLERLRAAVTPSPAEEVCATLMASLGLEQRTDDIALLALRRSGARPATEDLLLCEPFDGTGFASLRRRVYAVADSAGVRGTRADDFVTAVNEVMTNAVRHGGGGGELRLWGGDVLLCEISDRGRGFPADAYLDRRERPVATPTGGMGLWIAQQISDSLAIESGPGGTTVRIVAAR
jgi:sigma-B regulation protein RsbU (phosphoserine phosphatase)